MSKMSELDLMIKNQIKPIHGRLLLAQKDIKALQMATYADHRLMAQMHKHSINQGKQINTLNKMIQTIVKQLEDDDK